ncbi:MAG: PIN domain nuclease [Isosphaera sp.]|nr:PIN domain nuclease [Isosphaera sp.]
MNLLLDTHTLLWFALDDPQLSRPAGALIRDLANTKFVSPASYWEIAIKTSTGKYTLAVPHATFFEGAITDNGFRVLHLEPRHTAVVAALPFHHRDPFDRLLVAQALAEGMPVVSADTALDPYGVQRLW